MHLRTDQVTKSSEQEVEQAQQATETAVAQETEVPSNEADAQKGESEDTNNAPERSDVTNARLLAEWMREMDGSGRWFYNVRVKLEVDTKKTAKGVGEIQDKKAFGKDFEGQEESKKISEAAPEPLYIDIPFGANLRAQLRQQRKPVEGSLGADEMKFAACSADLDVCVESDLSNPRLEVFFFVNDEHRGVILVAPGDGDGDGDGDDDGTREIAMMQERDSARRGDGPTKRKRQSVDEKDAPSLETTATSLEDVVDTEGKEDDDKDEAPRTPPASPSSRPLRRSPRINRSRRAADARSGRDSVKASKGGEEEEEELVDAPSKKSKLRKVASAPELASVEASTPVRKSFTGLEHADADSQNPVKFPNPALQLKVPAVVTDESQHEKVKHMPEADNDSTIVVITAFVPELLQANSETSNQSRSRQSYGSANSDSEQFVINVWVHRPEEESEIIDEEKSYGRVHKFSKRGIRVNKGDDISGHVIHIQGGLQAMVDEDDVAEWTGERANMSFVIAYEPGEMQGVGKPPLARIQLRVASKVKGNVHVPFNFRKLPSLTPCDQWAIPSGTPHIFISYRRTHVNLAARILGILQYEYYYKVFLDTDPDSGLKAGDFQKQLETQLARAPIVVPLFTAAPSGEDERRKALSYLACIKDSFGRGVVDWCHRELELAIKDYSCGRKLIAPLHQGIDIGKELAGLPANIKLLSSFQSRPLVEEYFQDCIRHLHNSIQGFVRGQANAQ
ncbi:Sterile alpha and TIR motif-containing protein 1 [Hondaea fermentalgiana]|uniref:Sterile alpha and TIR motif-containing protein 1 n=1 Tax=Hondaea fermentalgiana TaxID=2315210 RepID=A0A2R5G3P2_9STRA|nr:Sterile alpha and TIR motif-containing protein 1 [Hondaea fermentalgiana]|eukprot:GBG25657.1 Sterile alpha and TIR motif-containing protein 1 [Hondaea fermentalgiana]